MPHCPLFERAVGDGERTVAQLFKQFQLLGQGQRGQPPSLARLAFQDFSHFPAHTLSLNLSPNRSHLAIKP